MNINKDVGEGEVRSWINGQQNKIVCLRTKLEEAEKLLEQLNAKLLEVLEKKAKKKVKKKKVKPVPPPAPKHDNHNYCGKILYASKIEAKNAMKLINRDLTKVGAEPLKRSYYCKYCEAWHLTTIAQWDAVTA